MAEVLAEGLDGADGQLKHDAGFTSAGVPWALASMSSHLPKELPALVGLVKAPKAVGASAWTGKPVGPSTGESELPCGCVFSGSGITEESDECFGLSPQGHTATCSPTV